MNKQEMDRILSKRKALLVGLVVASIGVAFIIVVSLIVASIAI